MDRMKKINNVQCNCTIFFSLVDDEILFPQYSEGAEGGAAGTAAFAFAVPAPACVFCERDPKAALLA
jgi:hypothetical protein